MCSFNSFVYAVSLFPNLSKNFLVVKKSIPLFFNCQTFLLFNKLKSLFNFKNRPLSVFFCFSDVIKSVTLSCFGVAKVSKFFFLTSVCENIFLNFFQTPISIVNRSLAGFPLLSGVQR